MILIADGGSTTTDWRLIDKGHLLSYRSTGLNPFFNTVEQIVDELKGLDAVKYYKKIEEVNFYGAGLSNETIHCKMRLALKEVFPLAKIRLYDDLTAACRALFFKGTGIGCILGTGSNSGLYIKGAIRDKIPPLGYILGDEGSGADIGKRFLNALLKRRLSEDLTKKLGEEKKFQVEYVLDAVYRERLPNRYLASLTRVVKENLQYPEVKEIATEAFRSFIDKNIKKYSDYQTYNVGFVGSVSWHFNDILKEVLVENKLKVKNIIPAPIDDLTVYHRNELES